MKGRQNMENQFKVQYNCLGQTKIVGPCSEKEAVRFVNQIKNHSAVDPDSVFVTNLSLQEELENNYVNSLLENVFPTHT